MSLKELSIALDKLVESVEIDLWEVCPPKDPKFAIEQNIKIRVYLSIIKTDTGKEQNYLDAVIKKARYSESLEDNLYEVLIEDSIQEFIEEKILIDYTLEEVN
jgi:hypothetical protein